MEKRKISVKQIMVQHKQHKDKEIKEVEVVKEHKERIAFKTGKTNNNREATHQHATKHINSQIKT